MTPAELQRILNDNPDLTLQEWAAQQPAYLAAQYEHDIQATVIAWAQSHEAQHPALELLYAVPNGGYRHPATAAQMKAEGQRAGVPDLVLPVSRRMEDGTVYHALYIELKRKGGKISQAQHDMIAKLQGYGNLACVCFGTQDAIDTLEWYVKGN